jgi:hypothetical protein
MRRVVVHRALVLPLVVTPRARRGDLRDCLWVHVSNVRVFLLRLLCGVFPKFILSKRQRESGKKKMSSVFGFTFVCLPRIVYRAS